MTDHAEALISEFSRQKIAAEGTHTNGTFSLSWAPDEISWRDGDSMGVLKGARLRMELSRSLRWRKNWLGQVILRPLLNLGIRGREAKLHLQSHVESSTVRGLPQVERACVGVPIEALTACLQIATSMGASITEVPAAARYIPPISDRRNERLLRAFGAGILELSNLVISTEEVVWLSMRPELARANTLELRKNRLYCAGIEAIFSSSHLSPLQAVNLQGTKLRAPAIEAIARAPQVEALKTLILDNNRIGSEGARTLRDGIYLQQLKELHLRCCGIRTAGAVALANAPCLQNVEELDLRSNWIGAAGIEALIESPFSGSLRQLWISKGNRVSQQNHARLREALPNAKVV